MIISPYKFPFIDNCFSGKRCSQLKLAKHFYLLLGAAAPPPKKKKKKRKKETESLFRPGRPSDSVHECVENNFCEQIITVLHFRRHQQMKKQSL